MTAEHDVAFRAAPLQEWLAGENVGTNTHQIAALLDAPVDLDRLRRRAIELVGRHEILRTRLVTRPGHSVPALVVDETGPEVVVEADRVGGRGRAELVAMADGELGACDPAGSPVRIVLASLGAGVAVIVTGSSVVVDERSVRQILVELLGDGPISEPEVQYPDYAAWHHDLLTDPGRAGRRRRWDTALAAPVIRPAAVVGGSQATAMRWTDRIRFTASDWDGSAVLSLDVDAATVLTAWCVLLHRLAGGRGETAVVRLAGRNVPSLRDAFGSFARDVPIAVAPGPGEAFSALRERLAEALAEATHLADDLDPFRIDHRYDHPTFQFVEDDQLDGRVVWSRETTIGRSPTTLRAGRDDAGTWIEIGHRAEALPDREADRLLERLSGVLRSALSDPGVPVDELDLCVPGESTGLALTGPPVTDERRCLHEIIAEQAAAFPMAIAVTDGRSELSYGRLVDAARRTAADLRANGTRPGDRIAVLMPRGPGFLVAVLGVLEVGAAFAALDVGQPAARLAWAIADLGAPVVVTDDRLRIPDGTEVAIVICGADVAGRQDAGDLGPAQELGDPADVAYVLYTSGSTGVPNGVPVTHHALLNYLWWAATTYRLADGSGALVHSSVGFDLSLTGLLAPLLVGQQVVTVPEGPGLEGLVKVLREAADLSLVKLTPTELTVLRDEFTADQLAVRTRTLVVGGEALEAGTVAGLEEAGIVVVNEYGPTETVVGCCTHRVGPGGPRSGPVPIGRPIPGTVLRVLDPAGHPVPSGVTGELYIGGVAVGSGYLNRPDVTRARFVVDPLDADRTLYRTGDRVVVDPDGDLVHLGRLDDQLAVRGVRVEPAEIEAAVLAHPAVRAAAVVMVGTDAGAADPSARPGAARLVAAYVLDGEARDPGSDDLTTHCRTLVATYLVPDLFVRLDAMPATANGKLDRAAVVTSVAGLSTGTVVYVAPRSPEELVLADAVAAVLGLDRVGIDDSYFALGGDSIRSVMVASRAQAGGVPISVADLHRFVTVRELASALSAGRSQERSEPMPSPFGLVEETDRALMPADVEDAFPLSLLQQGMIFHRHFAAKSAVYHAIASVRLRAPLRTEILRQVVHDLIRRHPMLRTSFDQTTFSRPLQLVHTTFRDPLTVEDLRGLDPAEQQRRLDAWVRSEQGRGFELAEHPLIRFMVHPLDDDTFQFTYGFHHEIVDGWSEALLVTELFGHYFSLVFDEPVAPRPPRSSMRDAIALELEALRDPDSYEFWDEYLHDPTLMRLPRPNGVVRADDGSREIVRTVVPVGDGLSDSLRALARTEQVPLKSILLAAHMAVMNTYHGHPDTLTYTVTNGRPESVDGSTAVGLFVNSLALRVRLEGGTWRELIEQTLDGERRSLPYRRLPMAELKRHQGNEPLAETLFFFTDYHVFRELDRWQRYGIEHEASELYGESTFPFCAIFRLNSGTGRLEVRLEYDRLQFSDGLMDEIGECYERILQRIATDPGSAYHLRHHLSDRQERRLTAVAGVPSAPGRTEADASLHEMVFARCRQAPDPVAVRSAEGDLTYGALRRRSARLAARLWAGGVRAGDVVALLAERSCDTVAALLAVLRLGAAYLPLNPDDPDERLCAILDESRPSALVVEPDARKRPVGGPTTVLVLDGECHEGRTPAPPVCAVDPATVAAVYYTSGSTGRPKGVVVTHGALAASTTARASIYPEPPARFALLSSLAFDSSAAGIFWTLSSGGTLVLPPRGAQREPADLVELVVREQISHTLAVPPLLAALLDQPGAHRMTALRTVVTAGEAAGSDLVHRLHEVAPTARLYNEYGPTENAVWSTVHETCRSPSAPHLPIGRVIPGVVAHALDIHGRPVPPGVAGELHLGGRGLARGYLGQPGATADRFRPDPFAIGGRRLYRTGDLVRLDEADDWEFLGRTDQQVKIRGFRVEIGEVEAALATHPDVHSAVVTARPDERGIAALTAFVVAGPNASPQPAELEEYLRRRLPASMVPAAHHVIDALPVGRSGKIDRSALPSVRPAVAADPTPPRDDTEQAIADIWVDALGGRTPGVHDDFFVLGGESLRAMQVVTRVNTMFGVALPVRILFDHPTVAGLARSVSESVRET